MFYLNSRAPITKAEKAHGYNPLCRKAEINQWFSKFGPRTIGEGVEELLPLYTVGGTLKCCSH